MRPINSDLRDTIHRIHNRYHRGDIVRIEFPSKLENKYQGTVHVRIPWSHCAGTTTIYRYTLHQKVLPFPKEDNLYVTYRGKIRKVKPTI